jgi:hypothetical protein
MNKQQPSWKTPFKRIRSNCGGCQKRHEAMQQARQDLSEALKRQFGRKR